MINKKKPEDVVDAITKAIFMDGAKLFPTTREKVIKIIYQELQKARQDWLRKEIVRLEEEKSEVIDGGEFGAGMLTAIDDIIDRYQAELDQDKK